MSMEGKSTHELEAQLTRLKSLVQSHMPSKLPDKGKLLLKRIEVLSSELAQRKARQEVKSETNSSSVDSLSADFRALNIRRDVDSTREVPFPSHTLIQRQSRPYSLTEIIKEISDRNISVYANAPTEGNTLPTSTPTLKPNMRFLSDEYGLYYDISDSVGRAPTSEADRSGAQWVEYREVGGIGGGSEGEEGEEEAASDASSEEDTEFVRQFELELA